MPGSVVSRHREEGEQRRRTFTLLGSSSMAVSASCIA